MVKVVIRGIIRESSAIRTSEMMKIRMVVYHFSGMRNTHFSVMGFGGNGVHNPVHYHTMEGQLFNEARKIRLAIRSLDFSRQGDNTDVLDAIYEASKMSFRTGASKSIVVIPCSDCRAQTIGYAALQQILSENSINLHLMTSHDFALRTNSPKTNSIFGIDNGAAYTMHHVNQRELRGDGILHRQVNILMYNSGG